MSDTNESPRDTTAENAAQGTEPGDKRAIKAAEGETSQVEDKLNKEQELGYRGYKPDLTPNEHYTLAGVAAGLPTPETVSHVERVQMRAEAETRLATAEADYYEKPARKSKTEK